MKRNLTVAYNLNIKQLIAALESISKNGYKAVDLEITESITETSYKSRLEIFPIEADGTSKAASPPIIKRKKDYIDPKMDISDLI
jgi:hypothetical protein